MVPHVFGTHAKVANPMKPRPRVTLFRLEQMDRILEIERAVFPGEAYDREIFLDLYGQSKPFFLVARVGRRIVGYAVSAVARGRGEIVSIGVDPRRRREGIGKALMRRSLRTLAMAGVRTVSLAVRVDNLAAIEFYRGFGFKRIRRLPGYYQQGIDALRMRKVIVD
jgi:[ribosomal protein S18]-alanine N-acetyltransferase